MVALMREFPAVKLTFNLVPSLLVQLEAFAEERARDWHLELGLKPADVAHRERARHHPLGVFSCAARPDDRSVSALCRAAAEARQRRGDTPNADFLDLQVWHKLAWVDPFYLDSDPRVQRLIAEAAELHRGGQARAARGRARDSSARHPGVSRGRRARAGRAVDVAVLPPDSSAAVRHRHLPADASRRRRAASAVPPSRGCRRAARARARSATCACSDTSRRACGRRKGRCRTRSCRAGGEAGFQWMATDEAILGRTIDREFRRDGQGRLEQPGAAVPRVSRARGVVADRDVCSGITRCPI